VSWCIWYGAIQKCDDAFVGWARLCYTEKTTSGWLAQNGKAPKFWARSSQRLEGNKSAIKGQFAQDLDRKLNHKNDLVVGNKITNRRIDSESTIVSSLCSNPTTTPPNGIFLASMLIQPWLRAAVIKYKSGAVLSEFWLGVEYQKYRGLSQLSNRYLLALIQSTV
jgi:hypothetical protein